jgi:hypothetical protein
MLHSKKVDKKAPPEQDEKSIRPLPKKEEIFRAEMLYIMKLRPLAQQPQIFRAEML